MQFELRDIKTMLLDYGLDPNITISLKPFEEDFEGIRIKFIRPNYDDLRKRNTRIMGVFFIVRFKENYPKTNEIANQLLKILRKGNISNYAISGNKVNYFYSVDTEQMERTENGYDITTINARLNYTYQLN